MAIFVSVKSWRKNKSNYMLQQVAACRMAWIMRDRKKPRPDCTSVYFGTVFSEVMYSVAKVLKSAWHTQN